MKSCTVLTCGATHYAKGLCRLHYRRAKEGKHGLAPTTCKQCGKDVGGMRPQTKFCCVACSHRWQRRHGCYTEERALASRGHCSLCEKPVHANGMCRTHSKRVWKHGDPNTNKTRHVAAICTECGKPTKKGAARNLCPTCYMRVYYRENLTVERARRNARRSRMKLATPAWADMAAIRKFYEACPPGQEVDHALPLKGRRVSGLHVLENLQYLAIQANRRKLNRFAA